jgi:hypothetical protein
LLFAGLDPLISLTPGALAVASAREAAGDGTRRGGLTPEMSVGFAHQAPDIDMYLGILGALLDEMC